MAVFEIVRAGFAKAGFHGCDCKWLVFWDERFVIGPKPQTMTDVEMVKGILRKNKWRRAQPTLTPIPASAPICKPRPEYNAALLINYRRRTP